MTPLSDEDIIFINDADCSQRKGVTVSTIKTYSGPEIRVAIWTFISVEGGYITPKGSGISLKETEYTELINKTQEIKEKIKSLSITNLDEALESLDSEEALALLKRKIAKLESKGESSNSKKGKKTDT
jgi:hypothetical protein